MNTGMAFFFQGDDPNLLTKRIASRQNLTPAMMKALADFLQKEIKKCSWSEIKKMVCAYDLQMYLMYGCLRDSKIIRSPH